MPLKIIFAGTSAFAVPSLEALINSPYKINAVLTQPDRPAGRGLKLTPSPIKIAALQHQLPLFQPESLRDNQSIDLIRSLQPDLMVVVVYGLLIPKKVLDIPRLGCINIHPSLLPRWRGAAPIQRAIEAGDEETGVSIMLLDEGWDTGPILKQIHCPIEVQDTSKTLHDRLAQVSAELLLEAIHGYKDNTIHPVPQDKTRAIYAPKLEKLEGKINWHESALVIERKIRAFNPWPGSFTLWQGKLLRIWKAEVLPDNSKEIPAGSIIAASPQGLDVATAEGVLRIIEIQLPGSKLLSVKDFLHGQGKGLILGESFQ